MGPRRTSIGWKKINYLFDNKYGILYKYPIDEFVKDIKDAGADACLVVDAPHELKEENQLRKQLNKHNLSLIKLVAPTTDDQRLKDIINISTGFIYQVNVWKC